jgi:hypothetical protein
VKAAATDLTAYRFAVDELALRVGGGLLRADPARSADAVAGWLDEPAFAGLFGDAPGGFERIVSRVSAEIRGYRPNSSGSAADLSGFVRICLLSQIDSIWWGGITPYQSDLEVDASTELVDVHTQGLGVRFRRQTSAPVRRAVRAAERRFAPHRTPDAVGLRFARTRPELAELLRRLAAEFAQRAPHGAPPLWVTSLARSIQHQLRLRTLGYAAMLPSAHCTGYGMDLAMSWYRRFDADGALQRLLHEWQDAGVVNLIPGEHSWHVSVSPVGAELLRRDRALRIGG